MPRHDLPGPLRAANIRPHQQRVALIRRVYVCQNDRLLTRRHLRVSRRVPLIHHAHLVAVWIHRIAVA
jgi:hypothetical protein